MPWMHGNNWQDDAIRKSEREAKMLAASTKMEKIVWWFFRNKCVCFKYQEPIDNYCLDFFFPDRCICLEIDGKTHHSDIAKESDEKRDSYLLDTYGIRTIRLTSTNFKDLDRFWQNYCKEVDHEHSKTKKI